MQTMRSMLLMQREYRFPFESCMVDDCISRGLAVQEGGAVYNFTGPQGFGIANMADSLYAIRKLVYEDKKVTMKEYKEALAWNYDKGLDEQSVKDMSEMILKGMQEGGMNVTEDMAKAVLTTVMRLKPTEEQLRRFTEIHHMIDEVPKFGNAIDDVDYFARDVAYTYTRPMEKYHNPRGGQFQAGLYPVSANVPLGGQTGATPDGRYAHTPGGRWRFTIRRKGCQRTYSGSNFCFQAGSFYRIQRNLV